MRYRLIIITLGIVCGFVWAEPLVNNGSFENANSLLQNVRTEDIVKDPKLLAKALGNWATVAWGTKDASKDALSIVALPDAPHGKHVAQIDNKINQISAFAYQVPKEQLTPGRWYEIACRIRTEDVIGQGAFLMVEFWDDGYGCGGVDSEHLIGTNPWRDAKVRFLAPPKKYATKISLWSFGGPGKVWFDNVTLREIPTPKIDTSKRHVIDAPFWGMFTCYGNYLGQYGKDMKAAGVYWQRQGLGGLNPYTQKFMEETGMAFEMCIDGVPVATDPNDPCYPVTHSQEAVTSFQGAIRQAGSRVRIFEVLNEPNTHLDWTLPGYANLLVLLGKTLKDDPKREQILFATGGFAVPQIGYTESCLKRGADKVLDIILIHPYCVDEPLDSQLFALADVCNRTGRPDLAIAINETGFPTWDPATGHAVNDWFISEEDQAIKIVKLHLQALAHKHSFVTYLGWNDFAPEKSDQAKNMGLVRVDGSPKPALRAYKFMTRTLGQKPRILKQKYEPNGTRVYQFGEPGKKPVWVVWNAIQNATITVDVGNFKVFPCDLYGVKQTIKPASGKVKIKSGYSPIYLVCVE